MLQTFRLLFMRKIEKDSLDFSSLRDIFMLADTEEGAKSKLSRQFSNIDILVCHLKMSEPEPEEVVIRVAKPLPLKGTVIKPKLRWD